MNFLFWLLWILDLLLVGFVIIGANFRTSFGAGTEVSSIMLIILVIILIGSLVLRYAFRQVNWSLFVVALPLIIMFVGYLLEDKTRVGE